MDNITSDSLQNMNSQIDWTPQVDMEFDTLEDAWKANGLWCEKKIYK